MKKLFDQFKNLSAFTIAALIIVLGSSMVVIGGAVTQIAGIAVAQSSSSWANLKDAFQGDNLTNGIATVSPYIFDGTNFDRLRGDPGGKLLASVYGANGAGVGGASPIRLFGFADGLTMPDALLTQSTLNIWNTSGTTDRWRGGIASVQGGAPITSNLLNTHQVGAANTAVVATIAAAPTQHGHIYSFESRCSAGTSSITIADGGITIWSTAGAEVGTNNFTRQFPVALTGLTNSAVTVTLAACGVGNTGTLMVQADRF